MSEQLLKAIIRLFILLAKVGGISEFERDTIRNFLNERLNQETALKYLKFLQQVETEYAGLVPGAGMVAQQDPYTQEIIRVANQINNELAHPQKIVLMLDLVTLMVADNVVEEKEVQVINTIRQAIRVDQADIDDLTSFAMASSPVILTRNPF